MRELNYNEKVRAEFNQYLEKIKSFGYRVFVNKDLKLNYAYVVDKYDVVSYVQYEKYYGLDILTKHHPHKDVGTGFQVAENVQLENLTSELINRSFCIIPAGYSSECSVHVKKVIFSDMVEKDSKFHENFIEV